MTSTGLVASDRNADRELQILIHDAAFSTANGRNAGARAETDKGRAYPDTKVRDRPRP
jgi:hypothetical protein